MHLDILCNCNCNCNENQPDALLIVNLFHQSTSTCFGHVYCPSSGGIHCICTAIGKHYTLLTGCWPGQYGTGPARISHNNYCTYTVNTC
jgi:hypothetical protein